MADADGLVFHVEASADAALTVNRVGFVVLHPLDGVAGHDVEVEHTDGTRETVAICDRRTVPLGRRDDAAWAGRRLAATAAGSVRSHTTPITGLASVAWTGRRGPELLAANTGAAPREVRARWARHAWQLGQQATEWIWREVDPHPLVLGPYAVAHLLSDKREGTLA